MQDTEPATAIDTVTTLHVCVTCRIEGDPAEGRAGRRLHDRLTARLAHDTAVAVVPIECLSVCRRPCTVSLAAPGKWTYVYGDLPPDEAVPTLVETIRLYRATSDGLIPWALRSDAIKKGVVARIPPLVATVPGDAA